MYTASLPAATGEKQVLINSAHIKRWQGTYKKANSSLFFDLNQSKTNSKGNKKKQHILEMKTGKKAKHLLG